MAANALPDDDRWALKPARTVPSRVFAETTCRDVYELTPTQLNAIVEDWLRKNGARPGRVRQICKYPDRNDISYVTSEVPRPKPRWIVTVEVDDAWHP